MHDAIFTYVEYVQDINYFDYWELNILHFVFVVYMTKWQFMNRQTKWQLDIIIKYSITDMKYQYCW